MIDNRRIGRAIRTLREKAGYTQRELAEKLFVSDMAVSKWETGKSIPDVATLKKMAVVLDMDIDGLLDGTASWLDDSWAGILRSDSRINMILHDKPVIDYMISYFLLAGIRKIYLCSDREQSDYIRDRFYDGEILGIQFCDYPNSIIKENSMVISDPVFLYGVDLTRFFQRAMHHPDSIVNLKTVVGKKGTRTVDYKIGLSYDYRSIPFFFFRNKDWNCNMPMCEMLKTAREDRSFIEEPMDKGFVYSELNNADDIKSVEYLIKSIQGLCGYLIYCPLEIAWRRGMISAEKMIEGSKNYWEYTEYIGAMTSITTLPLNSTEKR